jgi:hypothetical protein
LVAFPLWQADRPIAEGWQQKQGTEPETSIVFYLWGLTSSSLFWLLDGSEVPDPLSCMISPVLSPTQRGDLLGRI